MTIRTTKQTKTEFNKKFLMWKIENENGTQEQFLLYLLTAMEGGHEGTVKRKTVTYGEHCMPLPKYPDLDSEYKNVICDICGKIFPVEKFLKSDDGWYCSNECRHEFETGHPGEQF